MNGYSDSLYFSDDDADWAPDACLYDQEAVAKIQKKYRNLFGLSDFWVEEVLVKDQFKYQLITTAQTDDIDPDDPESYQSFSAEGNGWVERGLLLDKHGAATLVFSAVNGGGTLEITLSFGGGNEHP